jgi:2-oxoglutarate dehydrogenase E1 component
MIIADYREHLDRGELLYNPVLAGYNQSDADRLDSVPVTAKYIENCDTKVPLARCKRLSERLTAIPENVALHSAG